MLMLCKFVVDTIRLTLQYLMALLHGYSSIFSRLNCEIFGGYKFTYLTQPQSLLTLTKSFLSTLDDNNLYVTDRQLMELWKDHSSISCLETKDISENFK